MEGVPLRGAADAGEPRPNTVPLPPAPLPRRLRLAGRLRFGALALLLAGVGLAGAGQYWFLSRRDYLVDGVILYLAGMLLFALLVRSLEGPAARAGPRAGSFWQLVVGNWRRLGLSGLGLLLAAWAGRLAVAQPPPKDFAPAVAAWLTGCALVLAAQLPPPAAWRPWPGRARAWLYNHRLEASAVALWVLLAAALRLWQLGEVPYPYSGDEANMGLEARRVLSGELRNPFATGWLSHPTMWFFWQAAFLAIFGADFFALRLLSALVGAGAIVPVYLLTREMVGARVAQAAVAILAAYPFHIHFSRLGLNNAGDPWLAAWAFFLFYRGLQRRERVTLVLAGATLGLMQYGYMGSRVALIIGTAYVLFLLFAERDSVTGQIGSLAVAATAALAVALPIVWWYYAHPLDLTARLVNIGVFQSGWLDQEVVKTGRSAFQLMWDQVQRSFLAFNVYPDASPFYRPPGPLLGFWPSLSFAFGGAYAVLRWRDRRMALLLLWVGLTMVFGNVLTLTAPNAARLVIAIPAVCILVAVGLEKVVALGIKAVGLAERMTVPVLAVVVGLIMVLDVAFYFGEYTPNRYFADTNGEIATLTGRYLARLDGDYKVYFLGAPRMYLGFASIAYLAGEEYTSPKEVGTDVLQPLPPGERPAMVEGNSRLVFIFLPERLKEMGTVQAFFPGGEVLSFSGRFGKDLFTVYRVD